MDDPATTPAIRRIQTRSFVRSLRAHPRHAELLRRINESFDVSSLDTGFDFGWVPLTEHEHVTRSALATLGQDAYVALWNQTFLHSLRQPFLKAFTGLMSHLSSDSLIALARRSPSVYEHITRGCGSLRWTQRGSGGSLSIEHFPNGHDFEAWALSNLGSLQAGAVHMGHPPDAVVLEQMDLDRPLATYRVRAPLESG